MATGASIRHNSQRHLRDLSPRRIVGFACNQGFIFFLLYCSTGPTAEAGTMSLQRLGLLAALVALVAGFALVRLLGSRRLDGLLARPLLYVYAVTAALGSLLLLLFPQAQTAMALLQGVLTGAPCVLLLTAWGRAFGCTSTTNAVPEVFLGSLVGALLCLIFSLLDPSSPLLLATRLFPLASVVNIEIPPGNQSQRPTTVPDPVPGAADRTQRLSSRILLGTFLFGLASGLMELYGIDGGMGGSAAFSYCSVSLVLLSAYLIGSLSLLLSDGFGRGAALNKAYRLAVFVMMVGILLVPLPALANSIFPGQALILAGYLGLEVVLVALFVVMAAIAHRDCALEFSVGFLVLFAGEGVGSFVAGAAQGLVANGEGIPALLVSIAGATILLSYIFFFTERDFDTLSQMVSQIGAFERAWEALVVRYGLSAREAEILACALRGRTNERIAQELVIAKSTVDTHLRRIYGKCGVHSRQELLDLAEAIDLSPTSRGSKGRPHVPKGHT